jgi:hypothetical protein
VFVDGQRQAFAVPFDGQGEPERVPRDDSRLGDRQLQRPERRPGDVDAVVVVECDDGRLPEEVHPDRGGRNHPAALACRDDDVARLRLVQLLVGALDVVETGWTDALPDQFEVVLGPARLEADRLFQLAPGDGVRGEPVARVLVVVLALHREQPVLVSRGELGATETTDRVERLRAARRVGPDAGPEGSDQRQPHVGQRVPAVRLPDVLRLELVQVVVEVPRILDACCLPQVGKGHRRLPRMLRLVGGECAENRRPRLLGDEVERRGLERPAGHRLVVPPDPLARLVTISVVHGGQSVASIKPVSTVCPTIRINSDTVSRCREQFCAAGENRQIWS